MIEREDQHALSSIVGPTGLLLAPADRLAYETAARHGGGTAEAVVPPADVGELSAVVGYLVKRAIPFTPQSGNTGGARFLRYGDMRRQVLGICCANTVPQSIPFARTPSLNGYWNWQWAISVPASAASMASAAPSAGE